MFGSLGNIWLDHLQFPNLSSSNWISICHIYVNIQRKHRKICECCLKGHKSLDSLCTVVKPLIVSLVRQRDQATTGKELKRHSRVIWALAGGKVTNGESGYSQHEDEKGKTLRDFGEKVCTQLSEYLTFG